MSMCESITLDDIVSVEWLGWETTWHQLKAAGWEVTTQASWDDWRHAPHHSFEKVYVRHPKHKLVGRLRLDPSCMAGSGKDRIAYLDFLTPERNKTTKPPRVQLAELTQADVPLLYEALLALQRSYPKPKPRERIVALRRAAA